MKAFWLISFIISFIKCVKRTENINNKVCSTDLNNIENCKLRGHIITQEKCEKKECCFYDN